MEMAGEEEDRLLGFLDTLQQAVATETLRLPQHTQEAAEEKDRTQPKRLLPCLAAAGRGQAEIELRSKLGEGGMGVVYLAEQVALGRPVAVKSISPVRQDARTVGILLHEAWITGQLEHPNVVPVYTLGQDEAGSPLLVMKRIEGVSWREVLSGKALLPAGQGDGAETEPLVRHLQVLMQVCRAVHFAHSRGIIHCDLKPDNVMIGEFGEVYVLDWGVAVSLHQERDDSYPLARDVDSPVGTPAYMSPEQAMGQGCRFSPATDVYLLGAILHEILTGERRHTGNN
ncbi:MAG: serine/threonine protein kinase, partial [Deltaproteobacteria bacterium]|nr:serine/threonine protein kinase [Deltaproteobacteria bacterium]